MIKTNSKRFNTPRATKKEIVKLARLNELDVFFKGKRDNTKTLDEYKFYFRYMFRGKKLVHKLQKKYDWRDEMYCENGLVGLRNVNRDILVPCGEYDFIYGCDYWDDASLAIASRKGLYGLIKRDGKGTVVMPFIYFGIQLMDYYSSRGVAVHENNIHIGYRKTDRIVSDLIVNGEVVVSGADWISSCEDGVIVYRDRETNKCGFYGVYWDGILTEPIFDEIIIREREPITFIKDGERGGLTIDKEFISLEKWDRMSDEQHKELWDNFVGYQY